VVGCGGATSTTPTNRNAGTNEAPPREARPTGRVAPWIKKLDDPKERPRAITELEQLGDPAAIEPLGRVWAAERDVRVLQVVISLARPLTPADAKARMITEYETTGRRASWQRAAPFLLQAVREIDIMAIRSVDAATKAADALGEAQLPESVEPLLALAGRPPQKKSFAAQIAATRTLGKLGQLKAQVAPGLAKLIDVDPPTHPKMAKTKENGRVLEEGYGMHLALSGAAINALAELHVTTESRTLVLALYRTPELATQLRRALVASGPAARDMLLEVLAGKHAAVEQLFKTRKLDRYCGDKHELPDHQCQAVSFRDFYAALILGDFRDPRAVPALFDALRPVPPRTTSTTCRADAVLGRGRAPQDRRGESAAPLRAMWSDRKADVFARIGAMEAYGLVAHDATATKEIATITADNRADDALRQAAAISLARLSTDKADIATFLGLAKKYLEASAKKRKEADGRKAVADAADKPLAAAKQALEDSRKILEDTINDPNKSAADIRAATAATKKVDEAYKVAKKKHKEVVAPFRIADEAAKAYVGYARMFQTHVARIDVAIRCKDKLDCYAGTLKLTQDQAATYAAVYIKDATTWTADDARAVERRSAPMPSSRLHAGSAYTDTLPLPPCPTIG
jgi:hypothetical protein